MGKQVIARVWRILAFAAARLPRPADGSLTAGRRGGLAALSPRCQPRRSGRTVVANRRRVIGGKQNRHRHKAQPKTGLQQRPRVIDHDQQQGQYPHIRPRPACARQAQQRHPGQHDASALRGYAPTGKHRIRTGHQQAAQPGRRWRRPPQTQTLRAPPEPANQPTRCPSKHGDVQARNTDQMRHPRRPKKCPLLLV